MLAFYVEWHLREAWRELLFSDTDQAAKSTHDPVAPARRSAAAQCKASTRTLADGTSAHSFTTLMQELSTIVRNLPADREEALIASIGCRLTALIHAIDEYRVVQHKWCRIGRNSRYP